MTTQAPKASQVINILGWRDLSTLLKQDNGNRYTARTGTIAEQYINENGYRTPSRAWPNSHATPLMTKKFARYVILHDEPMAKLLKII